MTTFDTQMKAFTDKAKHRLHAVVRQIVFGVSQSLIYKSPVGDPTYWTFEPPEGYVGGRFRGNWQYGENVIPSGTLETIDASGGATIGKIFSEVKFDAAGKHHFIVNNLPYAQRLERGWSRQAPHGMVGLTVNEYKPIVAAAVRAIQNES